MNNHEQKKLEAETAGYKMFMRVAKRISRVQYGKWQIVPDVNDPLRKFTLERDIGWATLKLCLIVEEFYHRGVDHDGRTDYRCRLGVKGLFADGRGAVALNTGMKLKPRMGKKLMKAVDEVIVPKFYETVECERTERQERIDALCKFVNEIKKVRGLKHLGERERYYNQPNATLDGCPFKLNISKDGVSYSGEMSYDDLAKMAQAMKWGEYK